MNMKFIDGMIGVDFVIYCESPTTKRSEDNRNSFHKITGE